MNVNLSLFKFSVNMFSDADNDSYYIHGENRCFQYYKMFNQNSKEYPLSLH